MDEVKLRQSSPAVSVPTAGEEMLQIISSATRDAIIMIDHEGKVTYWNKATEEMFGYAGGEILGKNLHLLLLPASLHQTYEKGFARFRETGQGQIVGKILELPALRKDGTEIPVELLVSAVIKQGQWHALAIVRDITARRRMEEELKGHRNHLEELVGQRTAELKRSNAELEQFAYVVSHDLREPLRMISSYLEFLEKRYRDKLDDDARDFIDFAVDGASRMQELINSLLLYSRIGTQGKPLEPTDAEAAFGKAMKNLERAIAESGAVVTRESLPALMADGGQLVQLFQNLIANAIKFRSDLTPQIHIGVRSEQGKWLFFVQDNGIGFDMKDGERIFGVFQRLYTRQEYPGTGIGLAIARKIVERHGGRIWAEAVPGEGTTFFFTLPMEDKMKQLFDRSQEKMTDRQIGILLIEDNPGDARLFQEMLKEASGDTCRFVQKDRLSAGLAYLSENQIDAILLDLGLPDSQGIDTFLNLQQACPHVPVIVLTGFRDNGLAVHAVRCGAQDYLVKEQVSGDLLFRSICHAIERKRMEEERLKLEELLHRAEKMEALGTMAGGVAHDLNNVLGVLMGYSELLMEKIPPGNTLRIYVDNIFKSTEKGAAIIQDLLVLARRGVTVSEAINLNGIVTNFLKSPVFEKVKIYHPRVVFRTDLAGDLLNIMGSSIHLEKTVMNLILNAAEATSGAGEVTIRTVNRYLDRVIQGYDQVQEGEYAVLTVSDNGSGIKAADLRKIFEPFYTKKVMGRSGTGLGLPIVWGTVKDHNGYIDVQSEYGSGSTFTLYFPVTRKETGGELQKISLEQYQGRGEAILVVDDVREQQEMAAMMLMRLGYQVRTVSSGEEAVQYLKTNKVDLLVLDMIMDPGIDGLETYRRVLEIKPRQKAILTSGFSETDRVKTAQALGAGAYVKKPYVLEKIGIAVRDELLKVK